MRLTTIRNILPAACAAVCLAANLQTARCATAPLVELDAANLPEGPLNAWPNSGSLKGSFHADNTRPQVRTVEGVKAVAFGGTDHLLADFTAPDGITGDKPFSCVVRVISPDVRGERALIAWATRPSNCLEIEYGDAPEWGAIGTYSDAQLGWRGRVPETGKWHHLVYTYSGGKDGTLQAWCDGELRASKTGTVATKPGKPFVVGACQTEADPGQVRYEHCLQGAIAHVRVYDRALSPAEIWNASGMQTAFPVFPGRDTKLATTRVTLKWIPGKPDVTSCDVYLGTDKTAVETAAKDDPRCFRGSQPATANASGPVQLELGKTYYWRVDQSDRSGNTDRGTVAAFSTDDGFATGPKPDDGGFFVEGTGKPELAWTPGTFAVKQNLYFGDNPAGVLNATKPLAAGLPATTHSIAFPVASPPVGKTWYWRVESVNRDGLPVTKGRVWSVRTIGKKLPVYLLGGQSNATGCAPCDGLPDELLGAHKDVIVFARGGIRLREYGWDWLRDGLGDGFGDKGKGCFGPELTFGTTMAKAKPGKLFGIIKCAWGATNLGQQWRPPGAGGETGPLYKGFVDAIRQGIAALDPAFEPEFAGMIWMQGESDSADPQMAADYAKNLTALIRDVRAETKTPDLPFVLGQISKAPAWGPPFRGDEIRAAQEKVAQTVPNTTTFPTDDYQLCDPWHYDTAGMISLGERFAKAMLKLEQNRAGTRAEKQPSTPLP